MQLNLEPATYFDMKLYLPDMLAAPVVEFEKKEEAPLVWVLSNCNAFNQREKLVGKEHISSHKALSKLFI